MSSLTSVFTQESLSLPNTPRSSFKESVRNSLRKLKRGRKSKQERREEERMRKKGKRGDFEVEVALTEVEEKEEVKGTVVRAHSSRRRGRERSTRCSLLEEIGKEVMVRVTEEGNGDSSFTIFPEMEKQKSNLLPRYVHLANSNITTSYSFFKYDEGNPFSLELFPQQRCGIYTLRSNRLLVSLFYSTNLKAHNYQKSILER